MLYMGIACLMAACLEIEEVYLNENGVMAIHAPHTEARAGSFSTRTANPRITRDLAELASLALGRPLIIQNQLVTLTKPDVVQTAVGLNLDPTIPSTVSCWSIGRSSQHCGYCVPCIIRRISCEFAEVADVEYATAPFDSLPATANWVRAAKDNVIHLITHALNLQGDDEEIELSYPELLTCGDQLTPADSLTMHRRWSDQCLKVIRRHPEATAFMR
jgi:hypothetical protein